MTAANVVTSICVCNASIQLKKLFHSMTICLEFYHSLLGFLFALCPDIQPSLRAVCDTWLDCVQVLLHVYMLNDGVVVLPHPERKCWTKRVTLPFFFLLLEVKRCPISVK